MGLMETANAAFSKLTTLLAFLLLEIERTCTQVPSIAHIPAGDSPQYHVLHANGGANERHVWVSAASARAVCSAAHVWGASFICTRGAREHRGRHANSTGCLPAVPDAPAGTAC